MMTIATSSSVVMLASTVVPGSLCMFGDDLTGELGNCVSAQIRERLQFGYVAKSGQGFASAGLKCHKLS